MALMILGGAVVIAGLLGALTSGSSLWAVLCLLSGVVASALLVGLGPLVCAVAELVAVVPHPHTSLRAPRVIETTRDAQWRPEGGVRR